VAAAASDPDVSHTAGAPGSSSAGSQRHGVQFTCVGSGPHLVAERTGSRLIIEQINESLTDHSRTSCHASMGAPRKTT